MDARLRAADAITGFFTPAPTAEIDAWIVELTTITRRSKDDEITERVRLSAYARRLSAYPADIARSALLDHEWLYFPAWAELKAVCEKLVAPRAAMLWHLRNAPPPVKEEPRELPSLERRAEMVAEASRVISELAEKANAT